MSCPGTTRSGRAGKLDHPLLLLDVRRMVSRAECGARKVLGKVEVEIDVVGSQHICWTARHAEILRIESVA